MKRWIPRIAAAAGGGTSYANTGGSGNRTSIITTSAAAGVVNTSPPSSLIDGNTTGNGRNYWSGNAVDSTKYVRFDFGSSKLIDEAKYFQENTFTHGVWKWQGSADASAWTDLGSSFTLGGVATQTITTLSGNTTYYRYYQIVGVSGATSNNPWIYQFEFKISA
jgi:hypothetical protein